MGIKQTMKRVLPESIKAPLRPLYRSVFDRPKPDPPSNLALGTFDGFAVAYRRGTVDERQITQGFARDKFFARATDYRPAPDHVIIDVGAHIGTFAVYASTLVPHGRVHAVEAAQDSANLLRINVALNRCDNVSVHRVALSDREGECELFHALGTWGYSIVRGRAKTSETVATTTLESFMEANQIGRCHFMKVNCEGAEFPILLSAPDAILQRFDTMVVDYHNDLCTTHGWQELVARLEAGGLSCTVTRKSDLRGYIVAVNLRARAR